MNERLGWWKFHRKTWNNPLLTGKRGREKYLAVWCWLLSEAQHSEGKSTMFKGKQIYLKPGQLTCGSHQISKATGVRSKTVDNIRKKFVLEGMIEEQTSNQFTLITIVNWHLYQKDEERLKEQLRNRKGTTKELQRTTEESKNVNNEEEVPNPLITTQDLLREAPNWFKSGWKLYYGMDRAWLDEATGEISLKIHSGEKRAFNDSLDKLTWRRN